jgi:hypothetical protein
MQPTAEPDVVDGGGCGLLPGAYESQGYIVGRVEVRGAFDLFQLVPSTAARAIGVDLPVEGDPFRVDRTVDAAKALESRLHASFLDSESPFDVTIVVSNIENCSDRDGRKLLDVRYRTFTTHLPEARGLTIESRDAQRTDPAAAAGVLKPTRRLKLAPAAAYNASDGFQAGGTVSVRNVTDRIDTLDAQAIASNRSHLFRLAMAGSAAPRLKWLDTGDWRISIADQDEAGSPGDQFSTNALKAQFAAQTRPFGGAGALFRFGGSVEGGNQEAAVASNGTVVDDRTGYGALRAAAGIATGGNRYSAAASYGVLLGHVPGDSVVSYSKQIADFGWESQIPVADHVALQLEARLNAGWLLGANAAPLAEFFRGGNREESFLEGESWIIRSNPFLRSVPSNRLDRTSPVTSLGGDRFVAMNVTLSAPVWRYPLIPLWLSRSESFKSGIAAAQETARSQAAVYYQSEDPAQPDGRRCGEGDRGPRHAVRRLLRQRRQRGRRPSGCARRLPRRRGRGPGQDDARERHRLRPDRNQGGSRRRVGMRGRTWPRPPGCDTDDTARRAQEPRRVDRRKGSSCGPTSLKPRPTTI